MRVPLFHFARFPTTTHSEGILQRKSVLSARSEDFRKTPGLPGLSLHMHKLLSASECASSDLRVHVDFVPTMTNDFRNSFSIVQRDVCVTCDSSPLLWSPFLCASSWQHAIALRRFLLHHPRDRLARRNSRAMRRLSMTSEAEKGEKLLKEFRWFVPSFC